jgi:hypothetical protein
MAQLRPIWSHGVTTAKADYALAYKTEFDHIGSTLYLNMPSKEPRQAQ